MHRPELFKQNKHNLNRILVRIEGEAFLVNCGQSALIIACEPVNRKYNSN